MFGFRHLSDFLYAQVVPIAGLAVVLLAGLAILYISGISRQRRMIAARKGEDVESFVLNLASLGFSPGIARSTYEYLVTEEDVTFPIHPSDRLDRDLHVSEEDIHRMVANLLRINSREALPGMTLVPFLIVEDVLRYVQASPRVDAQRLADLENSVRASRANIRAAG